ncbi:Hydrogenase expression/formation protein [Carpediemonas membranifera]|uniref:Hydrogenase expression/formation protein n=1 Tax=Carpediemonas membranifera TaxID=201153 RepID=A0A8J6BZ73_9EUKA|nr:Hydrogenase expression/formation protein [Carpediemonas membranifera]|eukprot:KAG9395256.1 Hydrogenase expression/formation protein [Carpediemonas membranifera]
MLNYDLFDAVHTFRVNASAVHRAFMSWKCIEYRESKETVQPAFFDVSPEDPDVELVRKELDACSTICIEADKWQHASLLADGKKVTLIVKNVPSEHELAKLQATGAVALQYALQPESLAWPKPQWSRLADSVHAAKEAGFHVKAMVPRVPSLQQAARTALRAIACGVDMIYDNHAHAVPATAIVLARAVRFAREVDPSITVGLKVNGATTDHDMVISLVRRELGFELTPQNFRLEVPRSVTVSRPIALVGDGMNWIHSAHRMMKESGQFTHGAGPDVFL